MRRRHGESMGNPRKKHAKIMGKLTRNGKKHWNYHWETHQTWWIYLESESVGFIIWYMWTKNDGKTNCHPMSSTKWWLNLRRFDGEWFGPIVYPSTMMALYCRKYQAISENKTCRNV
jgi:hypothetical protein